MDYTSLACKSGVLHDPLKNKCNNSSSVLCKHEKLQGVNEGRAYIDVQKDGKNSGFNDKIRYGGAVLPEA